MIGWSALAHKWKPLIGRERENITAQACDFCLIRVLDLEVALKLFFLDNRLLVTLRIISLYIIRKKS